MLVNCKCHGYKIDRDTAYKVVKYDKHGKGVNHYYCSQEIYEDIFLERERRNEIPKIVMDILGPGAQYPMFKPQVMQQYEFYSTNEILDYLNHRKESLTEYLKKKEFVSPHAKANYFLAIFKSELAEWKSNQPKVVEIENFEFPPIRYKARKRKPPLEEYEDGDNEI